ncbi:MULTISPECIES: hypothetical protein [unclassified Caballeronia]|uniref:hypothetical protein n=1 Tax=unclassified Caballeronia TaxID=2646786 RepID=UPI002855DD17|nr:MULTISPECIES: hypothetical protein [unclassified Caballeronia]MDR5770860.1 hypothetical protein [Caballeronia sp. LZ002]MDR5846297.1 hypothetical protein [Caballeronia sp. LZ003]
MDPLALYTKLGRLIGTAPRYECMFSPDTDTMRWLGQVDAAIKETGDAMLVIKIDNAIANLHNAIPIARAQSAQDIMILLHRALGLAEVKAPAGFAGTFIPAGNRFDAFAGIVKVLKAATKDVLIADPWMDETILTEFAVVATEAPSLRLLTVKRSSNDALLAAARKWTEQYGPARPVEVRGVHKPQLHDRLILVDSSTAYSITQSFKDIARTASAELIKARSDDTLKIEAYETLWAESTVLYRPDCGVLKL